MFYIYILYSKSIDKYYVGYSQNPDERLVFHNSEKNKIWSKRGIPWEIKCVIQFLDKSEALKAEKFVKKQKSRAFIEDIINSKEIKGLKSI